MLARVKARMPDITVEAWVHASRASVTWNDGTRRYHLWLTLDGKPQDDTIHSNPIKRDVGLRNRDHRSLRQSAAKWRPVVEQIIRHIAENNLVAKALTDAEAYAQKEHDARIAAANAATLHKLNSALALLPDCVREAMTALDDSVKLKFAEILER